MIGPAPFDQAENKSHLLIQNEFAEQFAFYPMVRKPNWPQVPDPTRTARRVRATFFWEHKDQRMGLKEAAIVSRVPKLSLHREEMGAGPRIGDIFVRMASGDNFEVTRVERDGLTGICAELVQLGVQD